MDLLAHLSSLTPAPLEAFLPPSALNGEMGSNRAPKTVVKQIDASNDLHAIQTWLLEFEHSPQTSNSRRVYFDHRFVRHLF